MRFLSYISEGITHIEDLDIDTLVSVLTRLTQFIATEKLDGAALSFGFDSDGKLFCSRQQKGSSSRRYEPEEWGSSAAATGFKSAHKALLQVAHILAPVVPTDVIIEAEVLFGAQPNAIIYGSSCIAFLRAMSPDSDSIISKIKSLILPKVSIPTEIYTSADGETIQQTEEPITWRFVTPQQLDTQSLAQIDFSEQIDQLKQYLAQSVDLQTGETLSVHDISQSKSRSPEISALKKQIADEILHNFKLPIKQSLLVNFVRTLQPSLRDTPRVSPTIDPGVEGVVLFDPSTDTQVKIVDKDVFSAFNQFNFAIRSQLKAAIPRPVADNLKLIETRTGSIYSDLLEDLAGIFGYPKLARATTIRGFLATRPDFSANIADFSTTRSDIVDSLQTALNAATQLNTTFKKSVNDLSLQAAGREFRYSPEIIKRTLSMSAEIITDLRDSIRVVSAAQTIDPIVTKIYKSFLANK
jgi:hypothetical protein